MQLRIFTEPQQGASYDTLLRVATTTEELGFDAFVRSDHYLKMGGSGLPGPTDAWVTMAGLARDTRYVRLGVLVSAATFRLPGPLAITVAQVDQMSGGRVEFGLGTGWYEEEHTAYGIPFPDLGERFERVEEQYDIVTGLWRLPENETFSYSGKHYTIRESPGLPKPVQSPTPPILVGGGGATRTPRLAARHADEFNIPFASLSRTGEQFANVRQACTRAGRDPAGLVYSAAQVVCCGRDEAEVKRRADAIGRDPGELRENGLAGTPDEVVRKIGSFAEAGAGRVYLQVLDLADLDHLELIAREVAPQVR